jgi:hypothetical protein
MQELLTETMNTVQLAIDGASLADSLKSICEKVQCLVQTSRSYARKMSADKKSLTKALVSQRAYNVERELLIRSIERECSELVMIVRY